MIVRLTGRLIEVDDDAVTLEVGGFAYELLVPAISVGDLRGLVGQSLTLHTVHYVEGNPGVGNLTPRLLGFLSTAEREFFEELTRVKGVSARRALRAMAVPAAHIAAAIERDDQKFLTGLPEIGRKTAAQMVTELRGRVQRFATEGAAPRPMPALNEAQRLAVEVLVAWGDRPAEAQRWVAAAVESDPTLSGPDQIVRAVYKLRQAGG